MAKRGKEQSGTRTWSVPPHVRVTRGPVIPAPSLFAHLAVAQFTLGALVIASIYRPFEPQPDSAMRLWMWVCFGALALALFCMLTIRIYIQDWLSTLSTPERLIIIALLVASITIPGPSPYHTILPEGFALLMPTLFFFSANALMARRYVLMTIVSFWVGISSRGGIELEWILAFGAALLWTLSAIHIAYLGSPFGLRGWWPFFRVWKTVIFYFIPTALAAGLFYNIWPEPSEPTPRAPGRPHPNAREAMRRLLDFNSIQWRDLIIRASVSAVVLMAALVTLYYLRKYFAKRLRPQALPTILGADVGEIEYAAAGPGEAKPTMEGNRGRVLRLWRKWERAVQPGPAGRESGETAAEYAARINSDVVAAEKPAIARMLEQAHYSGDEPSDAEVRAMETLVEMDLKDRS